MDTENSTESEAQRLAKLATEQELTLTTDTDGRYWLLMDDFVYAKGLSSAGALAEINRRKRGREFLGRVR